MNFSSRVFQRRIPIAIAAGLLLATAFPKIGIAGFAWIAPGLLLAAAAGKRGWEAFRIGYFGGLAYWLVSLYWLLLIPYRWLGMPLAPALGLTALSAYVALFSAVWVWGAARIVNSQLPIADWPWTRRVTWTIFCAASWVALEMARTRLLGGFPWDLLGVSQYHIIPLIQIASVTGVYGVSFLVVWTSASLLCALSLLIRKPNTRSVWLTDMIFPTLAVAAAFAFGMHRVMHFPKPDRELNVAVVQPAVPQTLIWNEAEDMNRFRDLLRFSELALTNEPDVLIWPEAALPRMIRYDEEINSPVMDLARRHHVWIILGSDDAERDATDPKVVRYFNGSFLVSPAGEITGRYIKRNLVIFGEYVPLANWLPFLGWFTPVDQGFTPGNHAVTFRLESTAHSPQSAVNASVLICFEDAFPQLARDAAGHDVDFLVNITNDGWFGDSAAQWQQAASACFRAVENNLPLVRSANTGLTCWIDEAGRFREILRDARGTVYGPAYGTFSIPLPSYREETFYHRHGDWFGWACVALSLAMLARGLLLKNP